MCSYCGCRFTTCNLDLFCCWRLEGEKRERPTPTMRVLVHFILLLSWTRRFLFLLLRMYFFERKNQRYLRNRHAATHHCETKYNRQNRTENPLEMGGGED